jgi:hypothetical protein
MRHVREPAGAAFDALLRPRRLLACGAHGFERRAGDAIGRGECVFGFREVIGRGSALRLRRLDLADQRAAFLREGRRRIVEA